MTGASPIEAAERMFRDMTGFRTDGDSAPSPETLLDAVRRFSAVEFDVPDAPDSDGFLFEYGTFRSLPRPGFIVSVVRQFEVEDSDGEHDHYVQLYSAYRYAVEPGLLAIGKRAIWWFRGGAGSFDEWHAQVTRDPVWDAVRGTTMLDFEIFQNAV